MTRNSELNCEDLFGCDHRPETPISDNGQVTGWLCRCGREVNAPPQRQESYRKLVMRTLREMSSEDTPYGRIGLVFVRELIERLRSGTLTTQLPHLLKTELLTLAQENQIELRSWSGLASEVTDIIDFCPVAPDGTALAIIRVIASTQVWR